MPDRPQDVEEWLARLTAAHRQQVEELAAIVRAEHDGLSEAIKWGRLTFTLEEKWHYWICAIGVNKRGVSLVLHKGSLLHDPIGLLEGEARYTRQVRYEQTTAHREALQHLLRAAIASQTDMRADTS